MSIHLTKAQIRQDYLRHRQALTPNFIHQASKKICEHIQTLSLYQSAQHLAFYHPYRGEVDLSHLWLHALAQKKQCYFPIIQENHTLLFAPFTNETPLHLNHYQISEPIAHPYSLVPLSQIDLIFLPIVAFDTTCTRLGMGKGYYDKTLAEHCPSNLIGVAYEWQKHALLPRDTWDISMTMIITEKGFYPGF